MTAVLSRPHMRTDLTVHETPTTTPLTLQSPRWSARSSVRDLLPRRQGNRRMARRQVAESPAAGTALSFHRLKKMYESEPGLPL